MYDHNDTRQPTEAPRDFVVYTIRLPLDLARAVRERASSHFEPQSVLVRRLVAAGLQAETEAAR